MHVIIIDNVCTEYFLSLKMMMNPRQIAINAREPKINRTLATIQTPSRAPSTMTGVPSGGTPSVDKHKVYC